jgi:uncharacterized membrane protein YfcA
MSPSEQHGPVDIESVIGTAKANRSATSKRRSRIALAVSFGVLFVWAIAVTATGQWGRIADNWFAPLIAALGSVIGSSTPLGGGTVSFPVYTKVLGVPPNVARVFSLSMPAIGMTVAALSIIINRRQVEWRALAIAVPSAIVGLLFGLYGPLTQRDLPFWPSILPPPYVRMTFTLVVFGAAVVVWLNYRQQLLEQITRVTQYGWRLITVLIVFGFAGGLVSSLIGPGTNIFLYIVLIIFIGLIPRIGVPTSVIAMASTCVIAFIMMSLIGGQLLVGLNDAGQVVSLGGQAVGAVPCPGQPAGAMPLCAAYGEGLPPLNPLRYDVLGFWLASVPIVVFGAPLGAWLASRMTNRQLVVLVVIMAASELITTIIFLEPLRKDPRLVAFSVIGMVLITTFLYLMLRYRRQILGLPRVSLDRTFTRSRLDVGSKFEGDLIKGADANRDGTPDGMERNN